VGNRALRKQAAALIKLRGLSSKLYRNKRVAFDRQNARDLKDIIKRLSIAPGDWINDCDGWNAQIAGYVHDRKPHATYYFGRGSGYVFDTGQFELSDNSWSCSCGIVDPPLSRDKIEAWLLEWYKNNPQEPKSAKILEYFEAGGHVCDEKGVKLDPKEIPAFPGWK